MANSLELFRRIVAATIAETSVYGVVWAAHLGLTANSPAMGILSGGFLCLALIFGLVATLEVR